jgi:hypothetical protein
MPRSEPAQPIWRSGRDCKFAGYIDGVAYLQAHVLCRGQRKFITVRPSGACMPQEGALTFRAPGAEVAENVAQTGHLFSARSLP